MKQLKSHLGLMSPILMLLIFVLAFVGCQTRKDSLCDHDVLMSGELSQFLEGQMISYGFNTSNILSGGSINCVWRFRNDESGMQVFTQARYFEQINHFAHAMYGCAPDISRTNYAAYSIRHAGVGLTYHLATGKYPPSGPRFADGAFLHIVVFKPETVK